LSVVKKKKKRVKMKTVGTKLITAKTELQHAAACRSMPQQHAEAIKYIKIYQVSRMSKNCV
jgi:division protein CdvB (Snf7/Vps24/ESCRT-III family)